MNAAPARETRDLSNPVIVPLDHPGWRDAEIRALSYDPERARPRADGTTKVFGNGGDYISRSESGGWSCTCAAHGPCWHIALSQPLCLNCRTDRAAVGYEHCRGCAEVLAERAADALRTYALLTDCPDVPESTPEEVAHSASIRAELLPAMIAEQPFPEPAPVVDLAVRRQEREDAALADARARNARAAAMHTFVRPGGTEVLTRNPYELS